MQLLVLLDQRQQLALAAAQQVNLVKHEANFCRRMFQHLDRELIALIQLARCVHDQQDNVATFHSLAHLDHHLAAEGAVRLVYAGSIDQDDLRAALVFTFTLGNIDDALDPVACGLRLRRDDREFFAHKRIEQRGLARVRATENANKTGVEGHRVGLRASAIGLRQISGHLRLNDRSSIPTISGRVLE